MNPMLPYDHPSTMKSLGSNYDDRVAMCLFRQLHSKDPTLTSLNFNKTIIKALRFPGSRLRAAGRHSVIIHMSPKYSEVAAKIPIKLDCVKLQQEQEHTHNLDLWINPFINTFGICPGITFMECSTLGNLYDAIITFGHEAPLLRWVRQIVKAAADLEKHGYAHGYLNPRNMVVNGRFDLVLTNLSYLHRIGEPLNIGEGPYVRPYPELSSSPNDTESSEETCSCEERNSSPGKYGTAGAVTEQFALGSIMWYMIHGQDLYLGVSNDEMEHYLAQGVFPKVDPSWILGAVMEKCWRGGFSTIAELSNEVGIPLLEVKGSCVECLSQSRVFYSFIKG